MADFVNYNKRSIDLPPGCKDLMDVLRGRGEAEIAHDREAGVTVRWGVREPLSNIEKHVQRFFQSHSQVGYLSISALDGCLGAALRKTAERKIIGAVTFKKDPDRERAVHDFLSKRGLNPPIVSAKLEPHLIGQLSPLPSEPLELSQLLTDFFLTLGLKDDEPMRYGHDCFGYNPPTAHG